MRIPTGSAPFVRWRRALLAEADASQCASAPSYCLPENVGVLPVVIPERELSHVERQVFSTDLVERPHDAALQERPEPINGASVDGADHVFGVSMLDEGVRIVGQSSIAPVFVAGQQIDFGRDCLADEALQARAVGIADDASD